MKQKKEQIILKKFLIKMKSKFGIENILEKIVKFQIILIKKKIFFLLIFN
jgi:hypothetical protein